MDFVSSSAAIEFCAINQLTDLQMVFKFEDQPFEIVCQITAQDRALKASPQLRPHAG